MLMEGRALTQNRRWHPQEALPRGAFAPTLDGEIIPDHMFAPMATPMSADVPVIIGFNRDEGTFMSMADPDLYGLSRKG